MKIHMYFISDIYYFVQDGFRIDRVSYHVRLALLSLGPNQRASLDSAYKRIFSEKSIEPYYMYVSTRVSPVLAGLDSITILE